MPSDQQNRHFKEAIQLMWMLLFKIFWQLNKDLNGSDLHKRMTHFVNQWHGTVKRVGQRKDKSRAWINDVIQYCLKSELLMT